MTRKAGFLARTVKRASVRIEWDYAAKIAGGEAKLKTHLLALGKKPSSLTKYQKPLNEDGGIPIQEIGDLVLTRLRGIVPKPNALPEELARAHRLVAELYESSRGDLPRWSAIMTVLAMAVGALPKSGAERHRPIAGTGAPPGP